jgi:hypothetical protein
LEYVATGVSITPVIFHESPSSKWIMWWGGNFGATQGCMERYPRAKKRNRGVKITPLFLYKQ